MAFKTIKRPKISLGERFYLQSILGGLWITIKHLVLALLGKSRNKKELAGSGIGVTMQYPEFRWDKHLPEYYRGAPVLVKGEDGRERCVSCQLCEFICPARAITITPGAIKEGPWGKVEKAPREFQIDMLRCIYCGMCEEACPEQAIFMSHPHGQGPGHPQQGQALRNGGHPQGTGQQVEPIQINHPETFTPISVRYEHFCQ